MSVLYPVLLGEVVITTANNRLKFREGATTGNADVAPGVYFQRQDGSATSLIKALIDALEAANASANEYVPTIAMTTADGVPHTSITIARDTGSDTFQLQWADAATTLDAALFGFADSNTALDAADKVSTLSPSCMWVGSEPSSASDPRFPSVVAQTRMTAGQVRTFDRGGPYNDRRFEVQLVTPERALAGSIAADTARSFQAFWELHRFGKAIELHERAIATGSTLSSLSSSSRVGTYVFDEATSRDFDPPRLQPGLERYSWTLGLLGYVA